MFQPNQFWEFSFPTPIIFGINALKTLPSKLAAFECQRVLLVTDQFLAQSAIVETAKKAIASHSPSLAVFSDFSGNPLLSHVQNGVAAFAAHKADSIVAIGGGAALDIAKAIALMATNPGDLFDYANGATQPSVPLPTLIAIPTTAGTGSEVGRSTVISDDESKIKHVIFHPWLMPKSVILDPLLTFDLPPNLTAATGLDALSHLLESFIAPEFHPICDGIALEGLKLLSVHLPTAYASAKRKDLTSMGTVASRSYMLLCASMGAIAFQKGLGATHSCAHALSTVCDLHHGLANGIMIPYVMRFNEIAAKDRFDRVAHTIGISESIPQWLEGLKDRLEIPKKLSSVGVKREHLDKLVQCAVADGCHKTNPRLVTKADFEKIFLEAL